MYDARDLVLNRAVALKVHWPHMRQFSLRKEAQALAAIRHPAIASVYGFAVHEGHEIVSMERIWGVTLADHLEQRARLGTPFLASEAIELLAKLADGLAAVHAAGVAHRDVKPGNVMLAPRGRLVLMDFGIMLPEYEVARHAPIPGTAEYMAPEAIARDVAPGAAWLLDVYAFGITAFEVLAGRRPFDDGEVGSILAQHLAGTVPSLARLRPGLPAGLVSLVEACLAKDAAERPQSMESIATRLRALHTGRDIRRSCAPFTVLVVEDDPACADALVGIVRDVVEHAELTVVRDGFAALAALRDGAPDLVLLDVGLPGMSGIELCMYLRGARIAESSAIVSVSAAAMPQDVALLRQLGIRRFVHKGRDLVDRLEAAIREVLGTR